MRSLCLLLAAACTGSTASAPTTNPADGIRPVSDFTVEERVQIWPKVELVPENALAFRINTVEPQPLGGPEFTIYAVRGEQAVALPEAVPRWKWTEDVTQAIVEPVGLERGAPYLLVGEGLTGEGGPYATFAQPFRVIPADTTPPDGRKLVLHGAPRPGSDGALTLTFPEAMREDVAFSVATLIAGEPQPTPWLLSDDQRTLTYQPPEPWPDAPVHVSVGASAKDVAGNPLVNLPQAPLVPTVPVETADDKTHPAGGGE